MASIARTVSNRLSGVSIRTRLIAYLLIGIIPILLITLYFFWEAYQVREQRVLLGHMATAQATAGSVKEFIEGLSRAQEVIALTVERENLSYEQMSSYFQAAHQEIPIVETLGFALPSGLVVAGTPAELVGMNVADRKWFQDVSRGQQSAVSRLLETRPAGIQAFVVAIRAGREGRFASVLFSAVPPEVLQRFVKIGASPGVGYSILDARGRVIISNVLLGARGTDRSKIPSVRQALQGTPAFAEPFVDPADGVRRMGASVPVSEIGWVVNVLEPVSTAMAPVRRAVYIDLALQLPVMAALILAAWIVGTNLARPIRSLARKADAVARGDLTQRVDTKDRAELGMLANAFNNMTEQLDKFRTEIQRDRERALFLADVGELLTSSLDPQVILQTITEKAVGFIADIAIIFRWGTEGLLKPVALHAANPELLEHTSRIVSELPPAPGVGTVGMAVKEERTVVVHHISEVERPEVRVYMEKVGVISAIAVPMRVHGEIIGAFLVAATNRSFGDEDVSIVEDLSRRLGTAMENIRLYQEALERESFQRGLTDLAAAVSLTLEPEVVLEVICTRAQSLLGVHGVYVWILQEEERQLVGRAACGYNAKEFLGVTMPLEQTRLSPVRAITSKQGFFRHNVPAWEDSPLAERFQVQADMFQPLITGGIPLGVMVFTDTEDPNRFDELALTRSGLVSGYAATALANARTYERERRIAETLQRGLLPEVPEKVDGLEIAHFYSPARREAAIGGDFYDFIELDTEECSGIVVGDVSGKGLEAAVVTAMAKYAVRAYAAEDAEPYEVLARANNAIEKYTVPEMFVTMIYGLLFTKKRQFRYASAGHEPILIYRAKEKKAEFEIAEGVAAGVIRDEEFLTHEVTLSAGDMLILYTDGLTDARSPDGAFLDPEGLALLVVELAGPPAQEFLRKLIQRVRTLTAGEWADDVAVMTIRAQAVNSEQQTVISAYPSYLSYRSNDCRRPGSQ
ncbi:MAG TPA: SpoIIE family protein phosphatase [Armatimonadota bacterium]|nr:SpoIIE family protein phosphatase [Armatimonadota bacterium]